MLIDSRAGADVFNHLISLQQNLASGNLTAITATDAPALATDEDHVIGQISGNGVTQSALESASSTLTQQGTTMATQISNATSADLAQTITKLTQTQTAYQAALQSGVLIMKLSILQYIQ